MYNSNNPPVMIGAGALTGFGSTAEAPAAPQLWVYASADPIAAVQGASYFSDGIQRRYSATNGGQRHRVRDRH
jgi:hypothetical protein